MSKIRTFQIEYPVITFEKDGIEYYVCDNFLFDENSNVILLFDNFIKLDKRTITGLVDENGLTDQILYEVFNLRPLSTSLNNMETK